MKINIQKLQKGGTALGGVHFVTPLLTAVNTPAYAPPSTSTQAQAYSTGTSDNKNSGQLTEKDVYQSLKNLSGLPNDVDYVISKLRHDLELESILSIDGLIQDPNASKTLADKYLQNLSYLNKVKQSSKLFDSIYTESVKSGAIQEAAITPSGNLLTTDERGNVAEVSVQQYLANKDKIKVLTNGELLTLRRNSPKYTFGDSIFTTVQNGASIKDVTDQIEKIVSKLGKSTLEQSGYTATQQGQIIKGLEILNNAAEHGINFKASMGIDGLYKTTQITENQRNQAKAALQVIYKMLPQNYKALLQFKSGDAQNPDLGALGIIGGIISSQIDDKYTFKVDRQKDVDAEGKSTKASSSKGMNLSNSLAFLYGKTENQTTVFNAGTPYQFECNAHYGSFGNKIQIGDTLNEATTSELAPLLQWTQASMGGHRLSGEGLSEVVITDPKIRSVELPYKRGTDGEILPDFSHAEAIHNIQERIKTDQITDPTQINSLYQEAGMAPLYIQKNGEWVLNADNWQRFAVVAGMAPKGSFAHSDFEVSDDDILTMATDEQTEQYNTMMNQNVKYGKKGREQTDNDSSFFGGLFGSEPNLFKGEIFIPVSGNPIDATLNSTTKFKTGLNDATTAQVLWEQTDQAISNQPTGKQYKKPASLSSLTNLI